MQPEFRSYALQVVRNGRALSAALEEDGFVVFAGGTDNHLMLVDVGPAGLTGDQAEKVVELADLTCNKNAMPEDPVSPMKWRGVRLGVSAVTTRGMKVAEMRRIGRLLSSIWSSTRGYEADKDVLIEAKAEVATLCRAFPSYPAAERVDALGR